MARASIVAQLVRERSPRLESGCPGVRQKPAEFYLEPVPGLPAHFTRKCTLLRPYLWPMISSTFLAALAPLRSTAHPLMSFVRMFSRHAPALRSPSVVRILPQNQVLSEDCSPGAAAWGPAQPRCPRTWMHRELDRKALARQAPRLPSASAAPRLGPAKLGSRIA
jgi:hypothetical protein